MVDLTEDGGANYVVSITADIVSAYVSNNHLACLHLGAKNIPRERRRARNRSDGLLACLDGIHDAALAGLKEHDRLTMAKSQMERRLRERRPSSKLPDLVELVLSRPLVSTGMIQERLKVTKQGALNLVGELGLREMTGRGRFRAWDRVIELPSGKVIAHFTNLTNLTNLHSESTLMETGGCCHGRSKAQQS
ncbi:helix-turn-helix domain-containing protein [Mesorhizobium sp. M1365]|uniref:helix-turn-helix domain-containing protein n=1 Tax=Mesorhizobium sp. M1365 TaxID=2957090 RepID=UPI00333CEF80